MNTPIIHEDNLYEVVEGDLFVTYRKTECVKLDELVPEFKGSKIPRNMWKEILVFMKQSYDKYNSETLLFLFYDEKASQPWSYWVPPQITSGMTVKSDPDHENYKIQRKNYPDTMFGTVHHHCNISAFQSGTDEADEVDREGLHFTIGNLNKVDDIDIHCRITISGSHCDIPAETYIETAADPFKRTASITKEVKTAILQEIHQLDIKTLPDGWSENYTFAGSFKNVTESKHARLNTNQFKGYSRYQSQFYTESNDGWELDWGSSLDTSNSKLKKNEEDVESVDLHILIAEELIEQVQYDYEYEEILSDYYRYIKDEDKENKLWVNQLPETIMAEDLYKLITNDSYKSTKKGKEADKVFSKFLHEQMQSEGLDITRSDLEHGLQQLAAYEEGTGI